MRSKLRIYVSKQFKVNSSYRKSATDGAICGEHVYRNVERAADALRKRHPMVREAPFDSFPLKSMHGNELLSAAHANIQNTVDASKR